MILVRLRRLISSAYRGQPPLVRRQAEFSLLVWGLLAGILVARLSIRLTLEGFTAFTALRVAGYGGLLAVSFWLLVRGQLAAHVNVLALTCFVQCALLFPSAVSREFFTLSLFSMMAFAVLAVRPYQKAAAFGLFPALTAAKGIFEIIRPHTAAPWNIGLEDTVLTLLVFAASIPLVLFLIDLIGREIRRTEALRGENRSLKHEVGIDGLTGAWTRRQFGLLWKKERGAAERTGFPLALAIIDLDRFKRVNDRWGHLTGDQVLSHTADSMLRVLRQGDSLIRWGGDEFVALCPGAGHEVALALGAKLVDAVKSDTHLKPWKQRISVGIAVWQRDESLEALIGRADKMLYQAKKGGRNRVCATNGSEDFSCHDSEG